ncbi:iron complex transport system ATP-binding protein [Hephaestia caeni]|uniref:Iron complex transport system ATP-binding protein n=1 Tax=Hephaestia caeni TaxID=645617 RepID=A0A397PE47_9SPHN|nr:ATP-binding cassette domain-containing protein [Hephaestia caeni]RIA46199.1 iron complex transport system ATP-binding protein [Hephaestia caeni]
MIQIEQASLDVGCRTLLHGIDLTIRAGETTVLIGPNGAGKSSLVRLISGTMRPSFGRVLMDGVAVEKLGPRRLAQRRAVLAQSHEGGESFTVGELVRLGLRLAVRRAPPLAQRALVDVALADVGLEGWGSRIVGTLSGGERQRVHFARVLVQLRAGADGGQPGALLLDEPIAAQDPAQQLRVLDVAQAHAAAGGTVLLVLHDLNWAARVATRIVALKDGYVIADGRPSAVLTGPLLAELFEVDLVPCSTPADRPFVLPQMARPLATL